MSTPNLPPVLNEPPGNAGQLVRYVFHSAILPVAEVAIAAVLALLAGICGRGWNSWTAAPLNLYVVLIARSGIGKEHARDAIQKLMQLAAGDHKGLLARVNWSDMASAPALIRACATNPCFLNMQGEWGHVLKGMASPKSHEGPLGSLRRTLTALYSNKAPVGLTYSDSDKNVLSAGSVAFSMLAETTPGTFYGALSADMLADGFMSRFNVIEYTGDRPDENRARVEEPRQDLLDIVRGLLVQSSAIESGMVASAKPAIVTPSVDALETLHAFRDECAAQVRQSGDDESLRQLWNRAYLKMMKVACLLAVADNWFQPVVTLDHAQWAIQLVRYDIHVFSKRLSGGDVGSDDTTREKKLLKMCREYLQGATRGYHIPDAMASAGVVPRKYFQQRTAKLGHFKEAPGGSIRALDAALKSLCDSGYLFEVDKIKAADSYGFQGRCYRIVSLPDGLLY